MKKIFMAFLAGLMMAGCAQSKPAEAAPAPEATAAAEAAAEPETTAAAEANSENGLAASGENNAKLGGWTVNDSFNELLAQDDIDRFAKASEGLLGVNYTPIQVIATQLVSGTNYAYLASGTTVTAEPATDYYVVVVYNSLDGEVKITAVNKIDINEVRVKDAANGQMVGSWEATDTGKPGMLPGEDAQASFDEATKSLDGFLLNPIVLLGTQVVAGTNYMALCRGRAEGEEKVNLYVTRWCARADGTSELLDNSLFDIEYYVTRVE